MNESEIDLSLHEILKREIKEELGNNLQFNIGKVVFVSKRRYNKFDNDFRVLAIFFEVKYISGQLKLSDEDSHSQWIKPEFILNTPEKFLSKDEYEQYKNYIDTVY